MHLAFHTDFEQVFVAYVSAHLFFLYIFTNQQQKKKSTIVTPNILRGFNTFISNARLKLTKN